MQTQSSHQTLLSQLLWSSAWWDEDLLISNLPHFWTWLSNFEIPKRSGNFPDAFPKSEISDSWSHHCENKFHQYDLTIHLHFGSVAEFAVLVSFHSPASLYFLPYQVSVLEKMRPNSWNCWREQKFVLLEQMVVRKRFLMYPKYSVYRAAIQNRGYAYLWDSE